jgi:hypothetical protein
MDLYLHSSRKNECLVYSTIHIIIYQTQINDGIVLPRKQVKNVILYNIL